MTTEAIEVAGKKDMFIFAKNSAEMAQAQDRTIAGMKTKVEVEKARLTDLELNLEIAKKNKWRTETLKRHVGYAKDKVAFYEKIISALEAGYQIVPDMDVELFAVRTSKKTPSSKTVTGTASYGGPALNSHTSNHPPVGEGKYVHPNRGLSQADDWEKDDKDGKKVKMQTRWWEDFTSPEFPFQLVKSPILVMTGEAMKKLIFDEMGVLPRTRGADPVVVGRITLKGSRTWQRKSVNFMVAWFIDLDTL
jgi:hypothetical protein